MVVFFVGQQSQLYFPCQQIRVTERNRRVLRFYEEGKEAWIGFHDNPLTGFRFPAAVRCTVKNPGTPVLTYLLPDCT